MLWDDGARGERIRSMAADEGRRPMEEGAMEFSMDELREFLEGDVRVQADPAFKERLRRRLWEMLQSHRRPEEGERER
jgi:hypothetical protein